jgi:hypothetical protein
MRIIEKKPGGKKRPGFAGRLALTASASDEPAQWGSAALCQRPAVAASIARGHNGATRKDGFRGAQVHRVPKCRIARRLTIAQRIGAFKPAEPIEDCEEQIVVDEDPRKHLARRRAIGPSGCPKVKAVHCCPPGRPASETHALCKFSTCPISDKAQDRQNWNR